MARTSTYLNFNGKTERAFEFYRAIFGGEFIGPVHRFKDVPATPGQPPMPAEAADMVMHIELALLGGHVLMGTDAPESMGFAVTPGNNMHINLEPDSRAEADRLFSALAVGGLVEMPLQDMFWGAYFGSLTDNYGIRWMVNCAN
jgi:PhnB protein